MTVDVGSIAGCLLIFVICVWAGSFLGSQLRSNLESGKAVDQTLSELEEDDAPGMFGLQVLGFILLIGASALIGIGALVVIFQGLMNG